MCASTLSTIHLKQNDLSPFPSFHCWKVPMQDYKKAPKKEDQSNLINFQTRNLGFVCDMQLWRNVIIVKLADSKENRMPSLAIAHSVLYKLALGKAFKH